ncbi:MAG: hypothetical protein OWU33_06550 [Firmicutes bacterium]|nr:hypothetical protein [Bacillota bacterium]
MVNPQQGTTAPRSRQLFVGLAIVIALMIGGWVSYRPLARLTYVISRTVDIRLTEWRLRNWPVLQNHAFRVYYPPGQQREATLVLSIATQALPFEEKNLDEYPHHPLVIVVYPTEAAINHAVGEAPDIDNIGYEYDGIIDILSPKAWLGTSRAAVNTFRLDGPVPHELGHALLDLKADQDYPHWFNEGVAQYEDYRVTGYQWITPTNALTGPLYSMAQLGNATFYDLPNQSRAYREGLAMVEYLETVHGHGAFLRLLNALAEDVPFYRALDRVYHLGTPQALFDAWHRTVGTQRGG